MAKCHAVFDQQRGDPKIVFQQLQLAPYFIRDGAGLAGFPLNRFEAQHRFLESR
jgi:hypothetical protein